MHFYLLVSLMFDSGNARNDQRLLDRLSRKVKTVSYQRAENTPNSIRDLRIRWVFCWLKPFSYAMSFVMLSDLGTVTAVL
jgi:hypothetical protein